MKTHTRPGLLAVLIGALSLASGAACGAQLNLDDPDDVIRLMMKVRCSLNDGETALYWWEGRMYSRMPAEKDRHLFNVQGMNIRHCETLSDPVRGLGFVARSRELMFYLTRKPTRCCAPGPIRGPARRSRWCRWPTIRRATTARCGLVTRTATPARRYRTSSRTI